MNARLKRLLEESGCTVAFTGAGVSTLSGIRDFRGRNGVYRERWHGLQVEEILSIDCFRRHPEYFYEWAGEFVYRVEDFEPSAVHEALAELERQGRLHALYTQNIDLLHTKAGSRRVFELHGSPARHHCLTCGRSADYAEVAPDVRAGRVPKCAGCGGVLKPEIVFYGESLPEGMIEQGIEDFGRADLALVLGSSLTVYPAAMLPEEAVRKGRKLVIVNEQPTPLDEYAELKLTDLAEVFAD